MEKEEFKVRIGQEKVLLFLADPNDKHEIEFAGLFKEASATDSATVQEFIIRLNDLQKKRNVKCLPDQ